MDPRPVEEHAPLGPCEGLLAERPREIGANDDEGQGPEEPWQEDPLGPPLEEEGRVGCGGLTDPERHRHHEKEGQPEAHEGVLTREVKPDDVEGGEDAKPVPVREANGAL
jgi:hypothetical protein